MKKAFFIFALIFAVNVNAKIKEIKFNGFTVTSYMVAHATAHKDTDPDKAEFVAQYWKVVKGHGKQTYGKARLIYLARKAGYPVESKKK